MIVQPFSMDVATAMMQPHVDLALAAEFDFGTSGVTRVHSGVGDITIDGDVYFGLGQMGEVGNVEEQNTTSPTQLSLTLTGLDTSMMAIALNERCVGRPVRAYIVVFGDNMTSLSYNEIFSGSITTTALVAGAQGAIQFTVSNIFEQWSKGKPYRYTDDSHRKLQNGDRLFRYVAQMSERSIFWGSKKDAPPFRYT